MADQNRPAVRCLLAERRNLLNRIKTTEAKLATLRSRLVLSEVKLISFGYDVEHLRRAQPPKRLFKGSRVYRRVLDLLRSTDKRLSAQEIALAMAKQDGLDPSRLIKRVAGTARVKDAIKRARRSPKPSWR